MYDCYNVYIHKENELSSVSLFINDRDEKVLNYQFNYGSKDLKNLLSSDLPYVMTQKKIFGGIFGISVNKFVTSNNEISSKYEFIDTRLLGIEEFDNLLKRLIKETITEEQFTLYKKHLAIKSLID